ncbi:MAG: hypothetical protein Q9224_004081, partial [Gallowayella concinna]
MDAGGIIHLRLEHSTAADIVSLKEVDGVMMLSRRDHRASHQEDLSIIKKKVVDVALTLNIHPAAFGIQQQGDGTINTPQGVTLETSLVSDIFQWENRRRTAGDKAGTQKMSLNGIDVVIPSLVLDIKVKIQSGTRIDAVIVTEHRNLSELGIKNVLMVM